MNFMNHILISGDFSVILGLHFIHISPISAVSHVMGHGDIDVEDWLQRASQLRGSARDFLRCAPTAVRGQREVMVERMVGW